MTRKRIFTLSILLLLVAELPAAGTEVVSVSPAENATDIPTATRIVVTLDGPVHEAIIQTNAPGVYIQPMNGRIMPVRGATLYEDGYRRIVFRPDAPLAPGTRYAVTLVTADENMTPIQHSWFFTTAGVAGTAQDAASESRPGATGSRTPRASTASASPAGSAEAALAAAKEEFEKRYGDHRKFEAIAKRDDAAPSVRHEAHLYAGLLLLGMNARESEKNFRWALRYRKDSTEAEVGLAEALQRQGRYEESNKAMDRALSYDPDIPGAHFTKHFNYIELRDYENDQRELELAIAAAPSRSEGWLEYARRLQKRKDNDGALEAYRNAAESAPQDPELWFKYSSYCIKREKPGEAAKALERSIELGQVSIDNLLLLAELHAQTMPPRFNRSVEAIDRALALDATDPAVWRTFRLAGQAWKVKRKPEQLAQMMEERQAKHGESVASRAELGFVYALAGAEAIRPRVPYDETVRGKFREAARNYIRAYDLDPNDDKDLFYLNMYELGRIIEGRMTVLEQEALAIDHTRAEFMAAYDGAKARVLAAKARQRAREYQDQAPGRLALMYRHVDSPPVTSGYGMSVIQAEVNDAVRSWENQVSGHLGSIGVMMCGAYCPYGQ